MFMAIQLSAQVQEESVFLVGDIDQATKALTGMPYLKVVLIESNRTGHFLGAMADFTGPMLTAFWENWTANWTDTWATELPALQVK